MQQWAYLTALLVSLAGLTALDWRYRLAFFCDARRTLRVLAPIVAFFIVWDLGGIALGIFHHAGGAYTLPLRLLPEFPVEELCFLVLLSYTALLLYRTGRR